MEYTRTLRQLGKGDIAIAGGKGANLGEMTGAGLPVPQGFVLTTDAYKAFITANNLQSQIVELASQVSPDQPQTGDNASQAIRQLFMDATVPAEIIAEIVEDYASLGKPIVAVRSSATAEDLPGAAFAGQQDTYLNITGKDALLDSIKRCWASLWTARAMTYRIKQGIAPQDVSLAVVVQELVPADVAGILFTANPVNGRREQSVINASWGLGEAVVGGLVTPDTFIVDTVNKHILSREISDKQTMTARLENGTHETSVPDAQRNTPTLTDAQVLELADLGEQIETLYGMPMDIEWTLANGEFAIVQARPITALPEPIGDLPTDWSTEKGMMYMRGSIVEQMPDPLSPLFRTLGHQPMVDTIQNLLAEMDMRGAKLFRIISFDTINGYVYFSMKISGWKLLALYAVSLTQIGKVMGNVTKVWRERFLPRYEASIAKWQAQSPQALSAADLIAGTRELTYRGMEMYTGVQLVMPAASMSEMIFSAYYNKRIRREGDVPSQVFLLGSDSQPVLADKALFDLAQWSSETSQLAEFLHHIPAEHMATSLETGEAPDGIDDVVWQAWRDRFCEYLQAYGNTIYNMDFMNSVPADAPEPVIEALKFYMSGQAMSPHNRQQEALTRREAEAQAVLDRVGPVRRWMFGKLLRWAQKNAPGRENALAAVGMGWPLLRRLLRELGARLVEAGVLNERDDVFWLEDAEVTAFAARLDAGETQLEDCTALVEERKMVWRGQLRAVPPMSLPRGGTLARTMERMIPAHDSEQTGSIIKGIAVGEGKVTAPARVLTGPEDFGEMRPGEVLVASITTPAWTPLFALASAVVTDIGGPLSHSSIVAREYGIPAVLGTAVGSKRIQSGQMITVDGDAGTVTLLD